MPANNKYIEMEPYCINNEWKVDLPDGAGFYVLVGHNVNRLISVIGLSRAIDSEYFAGYKWWVAVVQFSTTTVASGGETWMVT